MSISFLDFWKSQQLLEIMYKLNQTNREYKNKVKQLKELENLNSPEAEKIINSLLLL